MYCGALFSLVFCVFLQGFDTTSSVHSLCTLCIVHVCVIHMGIQHLLHNNNDNVQLHPTLAAWQTVDDKATADID